MTIKYTQEELQYMNRVTVGVLEIADDCPPEVRESIEQKQKAFEEFYKKETK